MSEEIKIYFAFLLASFALGMGIMHLIDVVSIEPVVPEFLQEGKCYSVSNHILFDYNCEQISSIKVIDKQLPVQSKQESKPDENFKVGNIPSASIIQSTKPAYSLITQRFKVWDLGNGLFATNALTFRNGIEALNNFVVFIPENQVEKPKYFYDDFKFMGTNCFVTLQDLNLREGK